MRKLMIRSIALLFTAVVVLSLGGCYYDTEETLYPPTGVCDTSNVTFSGTIKPIVDTYCATPGCHDAAAASAGYDLTTYAGVWASVDNGSFLGSIDYDPNYSKMPKNSNQLDKCNITKIKTWINAGALNN
jgi:hypothetical protein